VSAVGVARSIPNLLVAWTSGH